MPPTTPPAVLLGGGSGTLSVARSLASRGVDVTVLRTLEARSPLRYSRACRTVAFHGTEDVQAAWLAWLERRADGQVVLACDDDGVELIARHRGKLEELGYRPGEADDEVALAMLDKERTYALAREHGVPCPRTHALRSVADVQRVADEIGFPCALKPIDSQRFGLRFGATKAFPVGSAEEAVERVTAVSGYGLELLATEVVPGPVTPYDSYFAYAGEGGEPLVSFTKRKLRQWPARFGLGTLHVSTEDAEIVELGGRFVAAIGLRGLAAVEFKRDARDGVPKLIECNHRFSDATDLVRRSGIDLASVAYERALGRTPAAASSYDAGVSLWFPVEDARAYLEHRRRGELDFGAWARSIEPPLGFPFLSPADPGPSLASLSWLAARILRRATRR